MPLFAPVALAPDSFPAVRLKNPPAIDGRIDPNEWADAPVVSGTGFDEETGTPGIENSEYRIAYDDKFIYFAARLSDSQPKRIRATEFRQNVNLGGDDFVGMYVDPFGTLNDVNNFDINPLGATNIRVNGGRAAKREWLGEMEAKSRRTDTGWEAEARIPWSVMRLPKSGRRDFRVGFYRVISRTQRSYIFSNIANNQVANTPYWKGVEVPNVERSKSIKLLPYGYGGYEDGKGIVANSGLDLKYGLTDDLDLVGSINPDFRNIENQVLSLDFSYFERLAGETRPFFLEGSGYFRTSFDAPLFASQRIPTFDAGLKAYGKIGSRTQIAVLNAQDFGNQGALVGTVRQNLGPNTNLVVAGTSLSQPHLENEGSFVSFGHALGPLGLFAQHQTTEDSKVGSGRRINYGTSFNKDGFGGVVEYTEVSPNFLPRLGFAPRVDYRGISGGGGYTKTVSRGPIMEYGFNGGGQSWRTFENKNFSNGYNFGGQLTFRDAMSLELGTNIETFRTNRDRITYASIRRPRGNPYRNIGFDYQTGRFAEKEYTSLGPSVSFRPYQRVQVSARYQSVRHFEVSDQTIISANFDANLADSFSARLVKIDDKINWYLSFRRAGNRGNEYYVILGDPNARSFRTSLILKAVMPINLRL